MDMIAITEIFFNNYIHLFLNPILLVSETFFYKEHIMND